MNFTIDFSIVLVGGYRVIKILTLNQAEFANEICLLIMQYSAIVFSDFNKNVRSRLVMGYFFSSFMLLHLFVNVFYIMKRSMKSSLKEWRIRRGLKKALAEHKLR